MTKQRVARLVIRAFSVFKLALPNTHRSTLVVPTYSVIVEKYNRYMAIVYINFDLHRHLVSVTSMLIIN